MKKKLISMAMFCVIAMNALVGCGKTPEPATKTSSYEEMVSYLTDKGYIDKDCIPVNINETEGYLTDNTGGEWTDLVVADEAYDYDGLWLFYWDGENESELYTDVYANIAVNGNTILLGGGAALISLESLNGYYGIAFSEDYADKEAVLADFNGLSESN